MSFNFSNLQLLCDTAIEEAEQGVTDLCRLPPQKTDGSMSTSTSTAWMFDLNEKPPPEEDDIVLSTQSVKNITLTSVEFKKLMMHFDNFKGWKRLIFALIETFGDLLGGGLSVQEMYEITKYFKKEWGIKGPRSGKTIKNTISAVCSNGVKRKELIVMKKTKCSYYGVVKL